MKAPTGKGFVVSAPASGQGKTTLTAGLIRAFRREGYRVKAFKVGPDYLDPMVLSLAAGEPAEPLDLWMMGEAYCRAKVEHGLSAYDLVVIEGAMGLYDGGPSTADLAKTFSLPLLIVMNVRGMAQTVGAVMQGLSSYDQATSIVGLIANDCASERHQSLIEASLPESVQLIAAVPEQANYRLPERYLGLVQAEEAQEDIDRALEAIQARFTESICSNLLSTLPEVAQFEIQGFVSSAQIEPWLSGVTIGVARDSAFSFIYQANLECLREMGATLIFFSPIQDNLLPEIDALWLPGGYPELHAESLASNETMKQHIKHFIDAEKPVLAECGGLVYCMEKLVYEEKEYAFTGVLHGDAFMALKRGCQGMQSAIFEEGEVRGHAHHRSRVSVKSPEPVAFAKRQRHPAPGEAIYRHKQLVASYLHLFFPSNPQAIANIFSGRGQA